MHKYIKAFNSSYTAGARWCSFWKNPLGNMSCDFQRIFLRETQNVFPEEKSEKHIMCFFTPNLGPIKGKETHDVFLKFFF